MKQCPIGFLQGIMSNTKRVLQKTQRKYSKVPTLPELGVKYQWNQAIKLPGFLNYMPDEWSADVQLVERTFFYKVLLILAEDYVVQLVKDVKHQREIRRAGGDNGPRQLQVSDNWIQAMLDSDYQSSKSNL